MHKAPAILFHLVLWLWSVLWNGSGRPRELLVWLMCLAVTYFQRDFFFSFEPYRFKERHRLYIFILVNLLNSEYQHSLYPLKEVFLFRTPAKNISCPDAFVDDWSIVSCKSGGLDLSELQERTSPCEVIKWTQIVLGIPESKDQIKVWDMELEI